MSKKKHPKRPFDSPKFCQGRVKFGDKPNFREPRQIINEDGTPELPFDFIFEGNKDNPNQVWGVRAKTQEQYERIVGYIMQATAEKEPQPQT